MKKIFIILGFLIAFAATGSALRVARGIYQLKGMKEQRTVSDIDASIASNKENLQEVKALTCRHYHRKKYE